LSWLDPSKALTCLRPEHSLTELQQQVEKLSCVVPLFGLKILQLQIGDFESTRERDAGPPTILGNIASGRGGGILSGGSCAIITQQSGTKPSGMH
jgi:predicted outer membrane repeat protein